METIDPFEITGENEAPEPPPPVIEAIGGKDEL
jgi:hypothetical protein